MERADIKLAIDMLEGVKMEEPCEDNMAIDHCINVLEDCGNDITRLRQQVATLTTTQCTAPWRDSPPCSGITRATEGLAQQVAKLTEQRDMAVEALKYAVKQVPELGTVPGISAALAAIQSSDGDTK